MNNLSLAMYHSDDNLNFKCRRSSLFILNKSLFERPPVYNDHILLARSGGVLRQVSL